MKPVPAVVGSPRKSVRGAALCSAALVVLLLDVLGNGTQPPDNRTPLVVSTGTVSSSPPRTSPAPQASEPGATPTPGSGAPSGRTLTILGAGDVLIHPSVGRQAARDAAAGGHPGYDFEPILAGIAPEIARADLAICHLETPLGAPGGPFSGYPLFSVPPQIATALRHSGYDSCSTASNHTLDEGVAGVYRTLDALDAAGLRHAGSYRSAADHMKPTIIDVRGVLVAHLSYTFGFNGLRRPPDKPWLANTIDPEAIIAEAARARAAGAQIVVVSLHWGIEYDHDASAGQVALAHRLLGDPAIDLILGSHSHVVQPIEKINGKWVVYGMGNQIARQANDQPAQHEGIMPRFTFTQTAAGRWVVTKVEAIGTWIDVTPRIRVVDLAAALADPATPAGRRSAYAAALRQINGYVDGRHPQSRAWLRPELLADVPEQRHPTAGRGAETLLTEG